MRSSVRSAFGWLLILVAIAARGTGRFANADERPAAGPVVADAVDFERDIAPVFIMHCLECHSERNTSGGLVLSHSAGIERGGEAGEAIVPGKPDESLLLERVQNGEMPPPKSGRPRPLSEKDQAALRKWIAAGAHWPKDRKLDLYERTTAVRAGQDWWSLQPVVRPEVPLVSNVPGANPIDQFILARLREEGMEPAPPADRRTLIRRVFYDLIGLPPTAAETEAFIADNSPEAYERLVNRLLESPHFGERWARHWLDLVRFAETSGYERDQEKTGAWKYRDWVIRAINDEMPYDRFVLEQLAGDELPDRTEETVTGTGFLRLGTWNDEPNDPQEYKYERLEDLVNVTCAVFLGSTVKCARCHDHKFDPIPQRDYYRVASAFWPGPIEPRKSDLLGGPTRDELGFDVLGWTDITSTPPPFFLLKKGEAKHPGPEVTPGALSMIPALDRPFEPPAEGSRTTGRRLQLARWIIDPHHPLTARVFVNRLWQHHFGQGLVRTPDNFGYTGQKPTHPELLDWLADEFIRGGWSARKLHFLMLTSRTYQQSSVHPRHSEWARRDFGNRLWWRAERRRLDAEALRDSMLAVSGRLNPQVGGPSFKPTISAEALEGLSRKTSAWKASPASEQGRRSIYIYSQRSLLPPLLTTFDFCDTTLPCGQRDVSTVAPQALALLNGEFAHEQSDSLAARVFAAAGREPGAQVAAAWQLALGRTPSDKEAAASLEHLARQRENFEASLAADKPAAAPPAALPGGAVLHLRADRGAQVDDQGGLVAWADQSEHAHHAAQPDVAARPTLVPFALGGRPAIRFSGERQFLSLAGQVLSSQRFTILAVARDRGMGSHREIVSNWNGSAGNAGTSVFLGTTAGATIRFSDDFVPAGEWADQDRPAVLAAVSGGQEAFVRQNEKLLARRDAPLSPRVLTTPYVIGRQGNLEGEYWTGEIAELVVYDRALDDAELRAAWDVLSARYGLAQPAVPADPARLALASLCHVLLNCNEFVYVD
jgi:hypothetical protein